MNTTKRIALAAALVTTLGFAGFARNVSAKQTESPSVQTNTSMTQTSDGDGEANDATEAPENKQQVGQSVAVNNSEKTEIAEASDGDGETNDDAEEKQEAAKYQSLAKITSQQAQQAAETALGGKAKKVELENEDGNLVYKVDIGNKEVMVDAGNAKILETENQNQEANDAAEANRPRSSIQVPDNENQKQ
ncbi:PepSY domain-containing protein [Rivularia sp. UHCC 0363]|uniref:PepSY domain-containing protein n=1 Tax=Rivularia sp. UHCC 0363 TaxID=3110244 RepID=UPI002B218681|nr:PepSY domain-containing protein [Rivularia sp. UHCC 0363]MEA5594078.1 PepSY domain-containing protein [Rivularia sp. UHCC 0363]